MSPARPVAFVTGASRGIGKAIALDLADAGYDVAVSARTLVDGDGRLDTDSNVKVPGGLDTTAAAIEARGGRSLAVVMDLLDRQSVLAAVDTVLTGLGAVDVLVNNAIYQGAGVTARFADLDDDELHTIIEGNLHAPLALTRALLPTLLTRDRPTIVNLVSATGYTDPPAPAGEGGWGLGYAASKAAFGRVAPILHVEYRERGLRIFSVDPGFVVTERMEATGSVDQYRQHFAPATPEVIGRAVRWLVTDPEADALAGQLVLAQREVKRRALLPGWPPC